MGQPNIKTEPANDSMPDQTDYIQMEANIAPPKIEDTLKARVKYITDKRAEFKPLLVQSMKTGGFPSPTVQQTNALRQLHFFLEWLDQELEMTLEAKNQTLIESFLTALCNTKTKFPPLLVGNARSLLAKWNAENWGEHRGDDPTSLDKSDDSGNSPLLKRPRGSNKSSSSVFGKTVYVPPQDDKVWGRNGMMHGIALRAGGGRSSRVLDPRFFHEKRDAKQFGNNGVTNGDWFPFQLNALFRGVHGTSQAGISGDATTGAYSVVVASQYEDFDKDEGNSLWYCGPGSNTNTDPRLAAPSAGTQALYASKNHGRDVRVLRSSNGKSAWAPEVGIRYDGLYRVMSAGTTTNSYGGRVERFRLLRKEGQPPIDTSRPTRAEVITFTRIQQASPRGWNVAE